jgi:hypothetical protein
MRFHLLHGEHTDLVEIILKTARDRVATADDVVAAYEHAGGAISDGGAVLSTKLQQLVARGELMRDGEQGFSTSTAGVVAQREITDEKRALHIARSAAQMIGIASHELFATLAEHDEVRLTSMSNSICMRIDQIERDTVGRFDENEATALVASVTEFIDCAARARKHRLLATALTPRDPNAPNF